MANAGVVYARPKAKDGSPLQFQVSGRLWRDTLIFFDTETETLWSQLLGRAVQGELDGDSLEHVPSVRMSWADWKALYPQTKALAKPAEINRSRYQRYFDAEDKFGISGNTAVDSRLPGKSGVLGLGSGEGAVAVALRDGKRDVSHVRVDGTRVCVVRDGARATAWRAGVRGGLRWSKDGSALEAKRGSSRWHPWSGEPLSLDTEPLEAHPSVLTYWFTWSRYHPDTAVFDR